MSKNTIELNNQAIERVKKDMEQTNQTQSRIDFQIKEAQTSVDECLKVLEQKQNELAQIYDKTEKLSKENEEFGRQNTRAITGFVKVFARPCR